VPYLVCNISTQDCAGGRDGIVIRCVVKVVQGRASACPYLFWLANADLDGRFYLREFCGLRGLKPYMVAFLMLTPPLNWSYGINKR